MNNVGGGSRPTQAELEAAARWHIRLSRVGSDGVVKERFRDWILASPANLRAFEQVDRTTHVLDTEAARSVMAHFADHGCDAPPHPASRDRWLSNIHRMAASFALLLFSILTVTLLRQPESTTSDVVNTPTGIRKNITLADGSIIALDQSSELEIAYSQHQRTIRLVEGQARFTVAHDARRPFVVMANNQSVVALGTIFNVERLDGATRVFLKSGRVAVSTRPKNDTGPAADALPGAITLLPGNQVEVQTGGKVNLRRHVDEQEVFAWEEGYILLNDVPLEDAVRRLNRYKFAPIVIDDASARDLHLSGMFRTNGVTGFTEAIARLLPVHVEEIDGRHIISCRNRCRRAPGAIR